jgi:hypothetical protein
LVLVLIAPMIEAAVDSDPGHDFSLPLGAAPVTGGNDLGGLDFIKKIGADLGSDP